ncbi:MAG: SDR family NAD(P)-dependent oxidoreductase [Acidimicrobiia bacterium]|nr:SDR family NAD(P)-dependent oxidoreductase [Acidimicrobiia bacterium]NNF09368.1 SDR family NAD(P)-dependent oxidoreductase [Acidimicrobiia bacterium]NNL71193.1 SDR family NAD(P)-dependent oxidoreductase [Acidimicrobiia bacterium]
MRMVDFTDRVAVVTGAGGGLGRQHALLLAERGATVVVNDLGGSVDGTGQASEAADGVVGEILAKGGVAVAEYSSVATPEGGAAVVQKALDEFGRIDVVINNAGILRDKAFHNMTTDQVNAVLDVHLRGAFHVTGAAWPHLREQGYGRVVMTSSASGVIGNFGQTNYGAAKMGIVGLVNVLELEGAKYNIKVNAIAPIAVTRMTEELLGAFGITADQFGPELVSPAVAYLASEDCEVSGEVWSVGGGSVSRFFIGLTDGLFKHPLKDGELTIEDVAAGVETIRSEAGYLVPESNQDEFKKLGAKFHG